MKYLLILAFVGTRYGGWQVQPNAPTVQQTVQAAAEALFRAPCAVTGCGRTDSGVHARRFPCTLVPQKGPDIPAAGLPEALNRLLPPDIAVLEARVVSDNFHPRYSAHSKEYQYLMYAGRRDPFLEGRAWHLTKLPDAARMDAAAREFIGTHDFASLMAAGSAVTDSVRTVYAASVRQEGNLIRFTVSGNGFLYHMVRNMVGTLLEVSDGRRNPEDIPGMLACRDRGCAGMTAPAEGLYLMDVVYPPEAMLPRV